MKKETIRLLGIEFGAPIFRIIRILHVNMTRSFEWEICGSELP